MLARFFLFQAEDGIRDGHVTGVQTCALPISHALGISDLQFGIIVIVNLTMGMLTPPVGGLLFVTSVVARVPLTRMIGELWPFLWAQVGVLVLLSVAPWISTALPGLFGYR